MHFSKDQICSLIDLTSLNETDTDQTIINLCQKAMESKNVAVCVYPKFIKTALTALKNSSLKIATVANFPAGSDILINVLKSIEYSLDQGADEIDVVFPYQKYMMADQEYAKTFIHECKKLCGSQILKVILETGVLKDQTVIAAASRDAILAGADFLKTSTGKVEIGATLEAVQVILNVIHAENHHVGIKISGGVRSFPQILSYLELTEKTMGLDWIIPEHFRLGMSRVLTDADSSHFRHPAI